MAEALYTNNAETTLNGAITNVATSITVTDGSVFPNPSGGDYFWLTITDDTNIEIVKVTARATHVLTVTRGQDGTSGTAFADGDKVQLRLTAVGLSEFAQLAESETVSGAWSFSDDITLSGDLKGIIHQHSTPTYDWATYQEASGNLIWTISGTGGAEMRLLADGLDHDGTATYLTIGDNRVTTVATDETITGNWTFNNTIAAAFMQSPSATFTQLLGPSGDASGVAIYGGDGYDQGGGVVTYGQSHASQAGNTRIFATGFKEVGVYDDSEDQWRFYAGSTNASTGLARAQAAFVLEDLTGHGSTELYITGDTTHIGQIRFGDTDSNYRGAVAYDHANDTLDFVAAGAEAGSFNSSGSLTIQGTYVYFPSGDGVLQPTGDDMFVYTGNGTGARFRMRDGGTVAEFRIYSSVTGDDAALYFGDNADAVRAGFFYDTSVNGLYFRGYNNTSVCYLAGTYFQVGLSTTDYQLRLYKSTSNTTSDHIEFFDGTTQVGAIGCQDTTWLRLNNPIAKNVYTNRYIRSDGGFFIDGATYGLTGSAYLRANNGSAGSPGISFGLQNNLGLFNRGSNAMGFTTAGVERGYWNATSLYAQEFTLTSDVAIKEDIEESPYGLDEIMQLRSRRYKRKDNGRTEVGLIAQEVRPIIPEVVPDPEDPNELLGITYPKLVSVLIKAVQELKDEIEELKNGD